MIYADTSFLSSAYVPDANSKIALDYLTQHKPRLPFAFLHWPELTKTIFAFDARPEETWSIVETDLLGGRRLYAAREDCERIARRAAGLMRHYVKQWPALRSLDVLHVATAIELSAKTFLTFDRQQRLLAREQKMEVFPNVKD